MEKHVNFKSNNVIVVLYSGIFKSHGFVRQATFGRRQVNRPSNIHVGRQLKVLSSLTGLAYTSTEINISVKRANNVTTF